MRGHQNRHPDPAREIADHAEEQGKTEAAEAVRKAIADILARPEHEWYEREKAKRSTSGEDNGSP